VCGLSSTSLSNKLPHGLLGSLAEWLAFFRRINEGKSNPNLLFLADQHFDRVPVDDAYCASADRFLLEAGIVCGRLELTLADNGKKTGENQRGR
jgi:hypothetical protein